MKERASLIGAALDFQSARGKGTSIHLRLPTKTKKKRNVIKAVSATNWG
jgi:nitrate/nitrite-specific signal transduction histidine kinase